jgi:SAM-dependent methyltransferase
LIYNIGWAVLGFMVKPLSGLLRIFDRVLARSDSIVSLKARTSKVQRRFGRHRKKIKATSKELNATSKELKALIGSLRQDLASVQKELINPAEKDQLRNHIKTYPAIDSAQVLASQYAGESMVATRTLDLGCGVNIRNPFGASDVYGIDIREDLPRNIRRVNLSSDAIPFADNFFDFCTAFDVLEHIPRSSWALGEERLSFIELMNEIHRVLRPGGLFLHSTPAYPSKEAFQDPTHVNIITEDTLPYYFCEPMCWAKGLGYGFAGSFELVDQRWVDGIWVVGVLRALK